MGTTICRPSPTLRNAKQYHRTHFSLEAFLEHWLRMEQGAAANIGMYASGIPMGIVVDKKGPRPAALLGAFALAIGYFPIRAGMIVRSATLKLD